MPNDGEQRLHMETGAGTGLKAGMSRGAPTTAENVGSVADGRSLSKRGCRKDL